MRIDDINGPVDLNHLVATIKQLDSKSSTSGRNLEIEVDLSGAPRQLGEQLMAALRSNLMPDGTRSTSTRTNVYDFRTGEDIQRWMSVIEIDHGGRSFQ